MENKFENEEIRYLGWKQPYAFLMLPHHLKDETRTWYTSYRGLVLITASKIPYSHNQIINISGVQQYNRIMDTILDHDLHAGFAIAIGRLNECVPMQYKDEDKCFVAYQDDLWVWKFKDVKPIKPFKIKGSQGWRKIDQETKNKIEFL